MEISVIIIVRRKIMQNVMQKKILVKGYNAASQ